MILESMQTARFAVIYDNVDDNVLPVLVDAISHIPKDVQIGVLSYDQPAATWQSILSSYNVKCYENNDLNIFRNINSKSAIFIDSFSQMSLQVGPQQCFEYLHTLLHNPMVVKVITVFHTDCIQKSSKTQAQLEHICQLTLSLNSSHNNKLRVTMHCKKGGKLLKATEDIRYDGDRTRLTASPVSIDQLMQDGVAEVLPHSLTTFKIGLENKEKLARNELELPYLKKSDTGKVHYEHDEADDWDDEDPDEDLDI